MKGQKNIGERNSTVLKETLQAEAVTVSAWGAPAGTGKERRNDVLQVPIRATNVKNGRIRQRRMLPPDLFR